MNYIGGVMILLIFKNNHPSPLVADGWWEKKMKIWKSILPLLKFLMVGVFLFVGLRSMWLTASQAVNSGELFSVIWGFSLFLLMSTILIICVLALTDYLRVKWLGKDEDEDEDDKDDS